MPVHFSQSKPPVVLISSGGQSGLTEATKRCAAHPKVETELACSHCGKPICPRCLVQTPVGARCRECARVGRLPTYELPPPYLLRGAGAALAAGGALGVAWSGLLSYELGFFGFIGLLLAFVIGYCVGEAVSWATNRKRGPALQVTAAGGVIASYIVRNVLEGAAAVPTNDYWGYVLVAVGVIVAVQRLR
jgi:hypothetical protein